MEDTDGKLQDIQERLLDKIEELCDCGFTSQHYITSGEFQCLSQPEEVTYRARLSGTASASSSDIIDAIKEWVTSGQASLVVQGVRRSLDSTCQPITVESFDDRECDNEGIPPTETPTAADETVGTGSPDVQSDNTIAIVGATVGGVISVAVVIAITVLVIAILVLLLLKRRHAELSIEMHTRLVL